jgi:hypothetical protein
LHHLEALVSVAKEKNVPIKILVLPLPIQLSSREWDQGRVAYGFSDRRSPSHDQKIVKEFCETNEIGCYFAQASLQKAVDEAEKKDKRLYFRYDFHFNKYGHQILSDYLLEMLKGPPAPGNS